MNDEEEAVARFIRAQTLHLRLDRLEHLLVATLDFKHLPPAGQFTDTLTLPLEVKQLDAAVGSVTGYLAAFNNIDLGNDVIHPGAFAATIAEAKAFARAHNSVALYPLLWQHQKDEPIGGIVEASEDSHGLRILTRLNLSIERGRQAFDGLTNGYLSFSIGYRPRKYRWQGKVRHLTEIALAEGSAVTFPMNQEARAISTGRAA